MAKFSECFGTSLALFPLYVVTTKGEGYAQIYWFVFKLVSSRKLSGCVLKHRTQTRDVVYDSRTGEPVAVERQTTTTRDTTTEDTGVLSGTVNAVGEVIALPFRAVGGLLRAIF